MSHLPFLVKLKTNIFYLFLLAYNRLRVKCTCTKLPESRSRPSNTSACTLTLLELWKLIKFWNFAVVCRIKLSKSRHDGFHWDVTVSIVRWNRKMESELLHKYAIYYINIGKSTKIQHYVISSLLLYLVALIRAGIVLVGSCVQPPNPYRVRPWRFKA